MVFKPLFPSYQIGAICSVMCFLGTESNAAMYNFFPRSSILQPSLTLCELKVKGTEQLGPLRAAGPVPSLILTGFYTVVVTYFTVRCKTGA